MDDGTLFHLGEAEYQLCTGERQIDWLLDSATGFDVDIAEVTEQIAALAPGRRLARAISLLLSSMHRISRSARRFGRIST